MRPRHTIHPHRRRGAAAVVMVTVLVVLNMVLLGMVLGGSRDELLTNRRIETVRCFYASEGGMNMAMRELMEYADEDGDGTIGTISDDATDGNDPTIGSAQVVVTQVVSLPYTTVTSTGRYSASRRRTEATVK